MFPRRLLLARSHPEGGAVREMISAFSDKITPIGSGDNDWLGMLNILSLLISYLRTKIGKPSNRFDTRNYRLIRFRAVRARLA